jgi:regulator of protease activity HflC (stomatin/prohibitin superfamily)
MSDTQSTVLIAVLIAALVGFLWLLLANSLITVPPGHRGLVLIRGRASEDTLPPGVNFVPAIRRRTVAAYPSVEIIYRAGGTSEHDTDFDRHGPGLRVFLGDRTAAEITYTVRFRLQQERLRDIHEQLGGLGVFAAVRDQSTLVLTEVLGGPDVTAESLFGAARNDLQTALGTALDASLRELGIEVTTFVLGDPNLGRLGDVIQATVAARHNLERESVEAAVRLARARNDAELEGEVGTLSEVSFRYRQSDLYRDVVEHAEGVQVMLRDLGGGSGAEDQPGDVEADSMGADGV